MIKDGTHLTGLYGMNPLGFLAAIGVQAAFENEDEQPQLWWSDDVTPHAVVDENFSIDNICTQALTVLLDLNDGPAVNPKRADGSKLPKGDELKLVAKDIRTYLEQAILCDRSGSFATSLLAEGSLDKNRVAKPSDFYFMAGNQKFLHIVRQILGAVVREEIVAVLEGPWCYKSKLPSLGWDIADDREYALRAINPSSDKKTTNPGAEALALLGLSQYPVFAAPGRTITQGCSGTWKNGWFSWPLWQKPATLLAVKSLLANAYDHPSASNRDYSRWYPAWGISNIVRSPIRRSDQGGYGTFGPPEIVW